MPSTTPLESPTTCPLIYTQPSLTSFSLSTALHIPSLAPGKNIREFFDIPDNKTLSDIYPSRRRIGASIERFAQWKESIDTFHTSLPLLYLLLSKLPDGRFFGAVS